MTSLFRRLAAPVAACALALSGIVAFAATPADAATPGFWGTDSPLGWNGTDYDDPPPGGTGTGAVFFSDAGDVTFVDTQPGQPLTGITGTSNFHVALATYNDGGGDQYVTVYISDQWLQDAPGGPFPATCAGANDAVFDGDPACEAFKADILTANGAAANFTYTGTSGFVDASNNPTGDAYVLDIDPTVVWPNYQGTASPFTYDGIDFDVDVLGGSGKGSGWLPAGSAPWFASDSPIALPVFPSVGPGGEIAPVHAVLLDGGGGSTTTLYMDGALLYLLDAMNPFPATCAGLEEFFTSVDAPPLKCVAFRADMWAPPATLGETYTCAADWETGWTDGNGDPIDPAGKPTLIDGFEPPRLTPIGTDAGPGVCAAAPPPAPSTPPGSDNPGTPTDPGGTGTGTTPAGTTGAVPTLPATGATTPALLLGALALLATGVGVTLTTRRRVRATVSPTSSGPTSSGPT